jgi:hypothetical protein
VGFLKDQIGTNCQSLIDKVAESTVVVGPVPN